MKILWTKLLPVILTKLGVTISCTDLSILFLFFIFFGFHAFIGATGAGAAPCQWRCSQSLQPLQARALGVLGVAGHIRHVPVVSEGHWVVVRCGPVDHERVLGVGAECGHDYSEARNGEGCH